MANIHRELARKGQMSKKQKPEQQACELFCHRNGRLHHFFVAFSYNALIGQEKMSHMQEAGT
jgi:hypothetical protein